jgi:hypothetical protein
MTSGPSTVASTRVLALILCKAEGPDPSDSNLVFVVIALTIIAAVCVFAAIPIATARRRSGRTEGIAAVMVLWGLLSAGSAIYFVNAQMAYSKEQTMQIMQNFDPHDQSGRPPYPWMLWSALAVIYTGATAWAVTARPAPAAPPGFDVLPTSPPTDPRD